MNLQIEVPYTTNPRMIKNKGPIYNRNPSQQYLLEKKEQLQKFDCDLYAETHESTQNRLVQKASEYFSLPIQHNIKDLALLFEEDIAIIHRGRLAAVCFCFPSGWVPADKIGLKLSQIHETVADSEKLVAASDRIAATISDPVLGSFFRQVWTITNNSCLSNHPQLQIIESPGHINELYLRTETQTTAALGDGVTSLFFVKVEVRLLLDVWGVLGQQLYDSVMSMSQSVLRYKNLEPIKNLLQDYAGVDQR